MALHNALAQNAFHGFIESVPAYCSLAIFYDVAVVKASYPSAPTAFQLVKELTEKLIAGLNDASNKADNQPIVIPVYYNGEDLHSLAEHHRLSAAQVIEIHTQQIYKVFMIGFLPGFAYMGKVDERIATPRHGTPRTHVSPGSVGIAGFQTGIYPLHSPGGWQLLGQTPIKIFDVEKTVPCLLKAGDHVRFTAIDETAFNTLNEYT